MQRSLPSRRLSRNSGGGAIGRQYFAFIAEFEQPGPRLAADQFGMSSAPGARNTVPAARVSQNRQARPPRVPQGKAMRIGVALKEMIATVGQHVGPRKLQPGQGGVDLK